MSIIVSDEDLALAVQAHLEHPDNKQAAADSLGWPRKTFCNRLEIAGRKGMLGTEPVIEGFEITKTTAVYDDERKLVREFIQQKPEKRGEFVMPEGHILKGISTYTDSQGRVIGQWSKTALGPSALSDEALAGHIRAAMDGYEPPRLVSEVTGTESDLLTVYPLVDFHIGLLAWEEETGANYDLNIAEECVLSAMARLIRATPPSDECIILGLGDLMHFDGYVPQTERSGNFLDADGRYPKVLRKTSTIVRAIVDMALQNHKRVKIAIKRGNHDERSAVAISLAMSLLYESHPNVTVDDSANRFWWHRFGKVFLGATHGDRAKMKDLPLVMAHDRPQDWAESTYKKIYTGHFHSERSIEEGGVLVTCMRTPVPKDAYHSFERYRSGRSVYSETFRIDGSEAATLMFNL